MAKLEGERVVIAFGCNLGNCQKQIAAALEECSKKINIIKVSKIHISKPYGVKNQPSFHNGVFIGFTKLPPLELLKFLKNVERKVGRKPRCRWCAREIDLDIVYYGNLKLRLKELVIPHPDRLNREFVLKPLVEIEPYFLDPEVGKPVNQLLRFLKVKGTFGGGRKIFQI